MVQATSIETAPLEAPRGSDATPSGPADSQERENESAVTAAVPTAVEFPTAQAGKCREYQEKLRYIQQLVTTTVQ